MDSSISTPKRIKLLGTIIDRGKGERVAELCRNENVYYNLISLGLGCANSTWLDYIGLGESEKEIVFSVVLADEADRIIKIITEEMGLSEKGKGVAFTIPITSVSGPIALKILSGENITKGDIRNAAR